MIRNWDQFSEESLTSEVYILLKNWKALTTFISQIQQLV